MNIAFAGRSVTRHRITSYNVCYTKLLREDIGLNGDMLEAQAFAYLAVRVARGLPTTGPSTTGVAALVGGGKVSRPG